MHAMSSSSSSRRRGRALAVGLALAAAGGAAAAAEVYGSAGLPGVMLGVAQPLGPHLGVRADLATLGTRTRRMNEQGIDYDATLHTNRLGLFADVHPMAGSFRIATGLAFNDYQVTLDGSGAGRSIQVGDNTYALSAADGLRVDIKYPRVMPYLGLGWGHEAGHAGGWRFAFDLGAMFGKPTVTAAPRGALASDIARADVDKEVQEVRDRVDGYRVIPQLTLSAGYSF